MPKDLLSHDSQLKKDAKPAVVSALLEAGVRDAVLYLVDRAPHSQSKIPEPETRRAYASTDVGLATIVVRFERRPSGSAGPYGMSVPWVDASVDIVPWRDVRGVRVQASVQAGDGERESASCRVAIEAPGLPELLADDVPDGGYADLRSFAQDLLRRLATATD